MKLTNAADRMIQLLSRYHTADEYLAVVVSLAEQIATAQRMARVATVHIETAMGTMWEAQPYSVEALVNPERCEECQGFARYEVIVGGLAHYYCDECLPATNPMAPDYPALAAEEPVTQNGDSRDAAEVVG